MSLGKKSPVLTFAPATWYQLVSDPGTTALWKEHYDALAPSPREEWPCAIDHAYYATMAASGAMEFIVARLNGNLVGYYIARVMRHPRYALLVAFEDTYWLSPVARKHAGGSLGSAPGVKFLVEMERALAKRRVKEFFCMETEVAPLAPLLKRRGYVKSHTCWRKSLRK